MSAAAAAIIANAATTAATRRYFCVGESSVLCGAADAVGAASFSAGGASWARKFSKNLSTNLRAVASIRRAPSWAILPADLRFGGVS